MRLFEAALVADVDHGPHAASIAVAGMARAINLLGDSHEGAGQAAILPMSAHPRS